MARIAEFKPTGMHLQQQALAPPHPFPFPPSVERFGSSADWRPCSRTVRKRTRGTGMGTRMEGDYSVGVQGGAHPNRCGMNLLPPVASRLACNPLMPTTFDKTNGLRKGCLLSITLFAREREPRGRDTAMPSLEGLEPRQSFRCAGVTARTTSRGGP